MIRRQGHGKAVDWYLLGVVFYEMLMGIPPYYSKKRNELFHNILFGNLKISQKVSPEAKFLIRQLL